MGASLDSGVEPCEAEFGAANMSSPKSSPSRPSYSQSSSSSPSTFCSSTLAPTSTSYSLTLAPTSTKGVNIVSETVPIWPKVRYISDTGQYRCTVSGLQLFFTILYNIQNYISNNSIYHLYNILYFMMELST